MAADLAEILREGLAGDPTTSRPSGIEIRLDLDPAGGLPVQPPSYDGQLEIHKRHVDDGEREVIELDSVGSCANRLEDALLELYRDGSYPLPVSSTTIEPAEGPPLTVTTLEMPHRVFDAWLRLSAAPDGDGHFQDSQQGKDLSMAHVGALDSLLETSAHDLLFGAWDSHRKGPHGQVRIGRSLTCSLIGFDPLPQAQFAARRDPLNLGDATDLPKGEKKLSKQGLSSIPPQKWAPDDGDRKERLEGSNGGVAITEARHLGFLSFAALRRLGFERYDPTDVRVMLAALGLYALTLRAAQGWDLRARCVLVPRGELRLTVVGPGGKGEPFGLSLPEAERMFHDAVANVGVKDRGVHLKAGATLNGYVDKAVAASTKDAAKAAA